MVDHLRLLSLTSLDLRELDTHLPKTLVRFEHPTVDGRRGANYEPGTVLAVVLLTPPALVALSAWLLKRRHRKTVEIATEIVRPDGTIQSLTIRIRMSESSSQADVIAELGQQVGAATSMIETALGQQ